MYSVKVKVLWIHSHSGSGRVQGEYATRQHTHVEGLSVTCELLAGCAQVSHGVATRTKSRPFAFIIKTVVARRWHCVSYSTAHFKLGTRVHAHV